MISHLLANTLFKGGLKKSERTIFLEKIIGVLRHL